MVSSPTYKAITWYYCLLSTQASGHYGAAISLWKLKVVCYCVPELFTEGGRKLEYLVEPYLDQLSMTVTS